jgi:hypothetical protein
MHMYLLDAEHLCIRTPTWPWSGSIQGIAPCSAGRSHGSSLDNLDDQDILPRVMVQEKHHARGHVVDVSTEHGAARHDGYMRERLSDK